MARLIYRTGKEREFDETGSDPDYFYWQTPSWTGTIDEDTGEIKMYELTVNKRDGEIRCSCMGCVCHHKTGMITDLKNLNVCKHIRSLIEHHLVFVLAEEQ